MNLPPIVRTLTEQEASQLKFVIRRADPGDRIHGPAVFDKNDDRIGQLVAYLEDPNGQV